MDDDILDNDGLKPDTKFQTFIRKERLTFYSVVNLFFMFFCISYFFGPVDLTSAIYLVCIYMINNFWLMIAYIGWRKETIKEHYEEKNRH
jgi:hypothetical protein